MSWLSWVGRLASLIANFRNDARSWTGWREKILRAAPCWMVYCRIARDPELIMTVRAFTSTSPRCLDGSDVKLLHRHHGLEGTLCFTAASASVSTRGVICQERPQRSLHQPHALSVPPLPTIAFQ